ncbi:MAG: T9SS type A sorting domain-containing protein [candidate division Zixibacteria bacterium]|nr:T9SS type A sorting domain-containing protein [candidate division Zixibacteria bacterium]
MCRKCSFLTLFFLPLACLLLLAPSTMAGPGDLDIRDSLISLAPGEPTLQEILDSLGYTINVATDELGWESFPAVNGTNVSMVLEKVSGSFSSAVSGWYDASDTTMKTELFSSSSAPGDSVTFTITASDSIGFYITPNLIGPESWYTQLSANVDEYDHAKIFATAQLHEYIIAFEDLKDGGDGDFNDHIIRVRFENAPPVLLVPGEININVCYEDSVCIPIEAYDPNGDAEMITVEMLEGTGVFQPVDEYNYIFTEHCFLPWGLDSTYMFVFKATDLSGAFDIDTVYINYEINDRPTIDLPDDFDTLLCDYDSICVPIDIFDPDGDPLDIEFLQGDGSFNPATQSFCFLPDYVENGSYTFVLKVTDSCCALTEGARPGLVPPPCPRDSITIGVTVNFPPELVTVPDFDTLICEPTEICFPVSATDANEGDDVTIDVTPPATYDEQTGEVCLMADQDGTYDIVITATDQICGSQAVDTVSVTVDLNSAPELTLPQDTSYYFCSDPDTVCFTAEVDDPDSADNHTFTLLEGPGTIDSETGQVCFFPQDEGSYQFVVKVEDECVVADIDTVVMSISLNHDPYIELPADYSLSLCDLEEVCFSPTDFGDPDLPGDTLTFIKVAGFGAVDPQTGEVCFTPLEAGNYEFIIRVRDLCGKIDQDTIMIAIELNSPPTISAEPFDTASFCELGDSVCIEVGYSDPDDEELIFEQIDGMDGNYDPQTGLFCFLPDQPGDYDLSFRVVDECELADTADVVVTVQVNMPPEVELPDDIFDTLCVSGGQVCFMADISDPDNQFTVEVLPNGSYDDGQVCFSAEASEDTTFQVIVRATDDCQATAEDTINVNIHYNLPPTISLPSDTSMKVCDLPDQYCFDFTTSDPDGGEPEVTFVIGSGTIQNGQACIPIDSFGIYCIKLRATDVCGDYSEAEACLVLAGNHAPELTVPDDITMNMCEPGEICFDVSATDIDLPADTLTYSLTNAPQGATIDQNGQVCYTPSGAGSFTITVRVTDHCGDYDEKTVDINLVLNQPPTITVDPDSMYYEYCGTGGGEVEVCFDGITISDPDDEINELTVEKVEGPGSFDSGSWQTCFNVPLLNDTIMFVYKVSDSCEAYDLDTAWYYVHINENCDTGSCAEIWIEETECVPTNNYVNVEITTAVETPMGGFDLLIKFDPTAFSLIDVTRGDATEDWEYFTYVTGNVGGCTGVCPDGLVRIISIADQNNGAPHPPAEAFDINGTIAVMNFYITSDQNFGGMTYPVDFYWFDCGDNVFSNKKGDSLFIDKIIYNPYGVFWDELDDVNYPNEDRYPNVGADDSCLVGDKLNPVRCLLMHNGSICIIHPDSIDDRGDLNMNAVPYEIADAVLYTNYFIYGPAVFDINYDGQVAASDVNGDGRALTVGDLIFLVRVITGELAPPAKLNAFANSTDLIMQQRYGELGITANSEVNIGAAQLVFDLSRAESVPYIEKSADISNMKLDYSVDGDLMRVFIYSLGSEGIPAGEINLANIEVDGEIDLIKTDIADYFGNDLNVNLVTRAIPDNYELHQNFPNPFNPETEIKLSLPEPSDWTIEIFNVNGQLVETFEGYSDGGVVTVTFKADNLATGIYFYRATAGEFHDTKKMVLMK